MDSNKVEEIDENTGNVSDKHDLDTEANASNVSAKDELNTNTAEVVTPLAAEDDSDESDKKDVLDWDDFIDEVALKDLELTHSDEDKEVSYPPSSIYTGSLRFLYLVVFHFMFVCIPSLNQKLFQVLKKKAEEVKEKGNEQFKLGEFRESAISYTLALRTCPLSYSNERSKLYSNRAASKMKLVRLY